MLPFSTLNVYKQLLLIHFDDGVMYSLPQVFPKMFLLRKMLFRVMVHFSLFIINGVISLREPM